MCAARRRTTAVNSTRDFFTNGFAELDRKLAIIAHEVVSDEQCFAMQHSSVAKAMRYVCILAGVGAMVMFFLMATSCNRVRECVHGQVGIALLAFVFVWIRFCNAILEWLYGVDRCATANLMKQVDMMRTRCQLAIAAIPYDPTVCSYELLLDCTEQSFQLQEQSKNQIASTRVSSNLRV